MIMNLISQNHRNEILNFSTFANNNCFEFEHVPCLISQNLPVDQLDSPHQNMTTTIAPSEQDYRLESNRLKTFDSNWPHGHFLEPTRMASAGFFYLGEGDLCRCAFCNVKIGNWEVGDDPMRDHQRWADNCPYVRHRLTGNVPITVSNSPLGIPSNSQENPANDECGIYNHQEAIPVEIRPNIKTENGESSNLEDLGIHKMRAPSFPQMGSYDSRLKSFQCWPKSFKQAELSEAGFYYSGKTDQTLCYHCGGGLNNWKDSDDPWTEHAKWFSKCAFLLLVKGKAFVDQVQAEFQKERESNNKETTTTTTTTETLGQSEPSTSSEKVDEEAFSEPSTPFDDPRLCKICFVEEAGVVFLPCGHFFACVKCAPTQSTCTICRQPFSGVVRAFLS